MDELAEQRDKIRKDPLDVRDREHKFTVDKAGVTVSNLPLLTKGASLAQGCK